MNNIFVVSGPSGSGKSTLIKMLREKYKDLEFSVSFTTRTKRETESDGRDYYFISEEKFLKMINEKKFAEWAKVHRNYYGTSFKDIEERSKNGKILILDIDVQGAEIIKKKFPGSFLVFIKPPDIYELKKRLLTRDKKPDKNIEVRLNAAENELGRSGFYDRTIINDKLEDAFEKLESIFLFFKRSLN
ncbi:MAG: guanylate kinase [Acidobacteriota bacterium]